MKINNRKVREIGRYLYMDDFQKMYILNARGNGYLMLNEKQQRMFQLFRFRFVAAMLTGFLFHYYYPKPLTAAALGASVFIVLHLLYRFLFLPSLIKVKGKVIKEKRSWKDNLSKASETALIKLMVLSAVICLLFLYNFFDLYLLPQLFPTTLDLQLSWLLYIVMIMSSALICGLAAYYLIKKRKEN